VESAAVPKDPLDLLYGSLDLLVLKTLTWQPMHGYAISNWIRSRSDGVLDLEDAALYKALHRLERGGAVASEWGVSDNNRKAKYYRLTPAGRQALREETGAWRRYVAAVAKIVEPA
jgi:transcriptional regulator